MFLDHDMQLQSDTWQTWSWCWFWEGNSNRRQRFCCPNKRRGN